MSLGYRIRKCVVAPRGARDLGHAPARAATGRRVPPRPRRRASEATPPRSSMTAPDRLASVGRPPGAAAPLALPLPLAMPRQTVAGMTLEAIRARILRGVYPEGVPLRQDSIADALGVSRIPVREALRQLEAEGLVTVTPHRGAIVSTLSLAEIEEVFALRAAIESTLLRAALPRLDAAA